MIIISAQMIYVLVEYAHIQQYPIAALLIPNAILTMPAHRIVVQLIMLVFIL
jgi:hypothetical protein